MKRWLGAGVAVLLLAGCSSRSATAGGDDAGVQDASVAIDASDAASTPQDAAVVADATPPPALTLAIVSTTGAPLQAAPGDALPLTVLVMWSDGGTTQLAPNAVTWLAPPTIVARDPYDAGVGGLPEAGAQPTAFFVNDPYGQTNAGVVYVVDPGTLSNPTITVTAAVADAGVVSVVVPILPLLVGDAENGGELFLHGPECGQCHGATAAGSPPAFYDDGGPILLDGGPAYFISGQLYSYPAPGLGDAPDSGDLAANPAWNAALLGMAAQSDMNNQGVALRPPMPDWLGGSNASGGTLSGQDFADIYAWLKTQTQ